LLTFKFPFIDLEKKRVIKQNGGRNILVQEKLRSRKHLYWWTSFLNWLIINQTVRVDRPFINTWWFLKEDLALNLPVPKV